MGFEYLLDRLYNMINKTEQEIDYSINQLNESQDVEEIETPIEVLVSGSNISSIITGIVTYDKNGKVTSLELTKDWPI